VLHGIHQEKFNKVITKVNRKIEEYEWCGRDYKIWEYCNQLCVRRNIQSLGKRNSFNRRQSLWISRDFVWFKWKLVGVTLSKHHGKTSWVVLLWHSQGKIMSRCTRLSERKLVLTTAFHIWPRTTYPRHCSFLGVQQYRHHTLFSVSCYTFWHIQFKFSIFTAYSLTSCNCPQILC
jgi:hypothetical protein